MHTPVMHAPLSWVPYGLSMVISLTSVPALPFCLANSEKASKNRVRIRVGHRVRDGVKLRAKSNTEGHSTATGMHT